MQHDTRSVAAPSALTELQRGVLTDLHSLSHAAHDSADGLLALAHVLLAPDLPEAPESSGAPSIHQQNSFAQTLNAFSSLTMRRLNAHFSQQALAGSATSFARFARRQSSAWSEAVGSDGESDDEAAPLTHRTLTRRRSLSDVSLRSAPGPPGAPERWATSSDRRWQLLGALADTCRGHHPWVAAFTDALAGYERGRIPFATPAAADQLVSGLELTLEGQAVPSAAQPLWQLLLIVIWGGEGHWALLLLKAALLRTHIDFELVFDLFDECLPVARAQVRAIAAPLYRRLRCNAQQQQQRARDLAESLRALRQAEGNVWVLPAHGPREHESPLVHAVREGLARPHSPWDAEPAPACWPSRRQSTGGGEGGLAYKLPDMSGSERLESSSLESGSCLGPREAEAAPDLGPRGSRARAPPAAAGTGPDGAEWTWVKLDPARPPAAAAPPLAPLAAGRPLSPTHPRAGGALEAGCPAHDILDLTKCWGPAVTLDPRASPVPEDPATPCSARATPPSTYKRRPRLQWPEGQAGPCRSWASKSQSLDPLKPDPADPPEPLTSSHVKELLVTDYGIALPPGDGLGTCGVCVWDRGVAALATGCAALAGACFATGRAPVPTALLRGVDVRDSAWPQFWCAYYAWALGHAQVLPEIQALVRAQRLRATRGLAASVRLLPLVGGAATAGTVGGLRRHRAPWQLRPKPAPATLLQTPATFEGRRCAAHALHCGDAMWLRRPSDAVDESGAEKGWPGAPAPAPVPAGPSPLPPIVNGLLGFPGTLFVGPTCDAAQRKTGSVFRPFHCVEAALRSLRPGQTLALLPGVYAPLQVRRLRAPAHAPIRILGLGRVVVTNPHKLRGPKHQALIRIRHCNNVVVAGLQLRTDGIGIDIGGNCCNIALHGLVVEAHRACQHPPPKYHNIRFEECVLNDKKRRRAARCIQKMAALQLRHRWVYVGMAGVWAPVLFSMGW